MCWDHSHNSTLQNLPALNPALNQPGQSEGSSVPDRVPEKFSGAAKKLEATKNCREERNDHVRMINELENKDIDQQRSINHGSHDEFVMPALPVELFKQC